MRTSALMTLGLLMLSGGAFAQDVSIIEVEVNKNFIDGNTGSVDVTLDCFTGLPITQTQTISNAQNVTFVVTHFNNTQLDCDVTETSTVGYTASYNNGIVNSTTSCAFDDLTNRQDNICNIKNTPNAVDVIVNKEWIIEATGGNLLDPSYLLELHCNAQIIGFTSTAGGVWNKTLFSGTSEADQEFVSQVIPFWNGGSLCWVSESAFDSSVEIHLDDCGTSVATAGLHIFLATGDECTVTNTVFYEGIPTLNQYGMAILALLMLGVGFVGFRRFA